MIDSKPPVTLLRDVSFRQPISSVLLSTPLTATTRQDAARRPGGRQQFFAGNVGAGVNRVLKHRPGASGPSYGLLTVGECPGSRQRFFR